MIRPPNPVLPGLAIPFAALLGGAGGAGLGAPHPESVSRSLLEVEGATARLTIRFQALSLLEAHPELDPDFDLRMTGGELDAGRATVEAYFAEHFAIETVEGAPLERALTDLGPIEGALEGPLDLQWLEASFELFRAEAIGALDFQVVLFQETDPWHRDLCGVVWNGEAEVRRLFAAGAERWRFEPAEERRPGVLAFYGRLGVDHILTGWDHLAFLVVLMVAVPRLRTLVGVVTAFTVAHSITLALAALNPGGLLDRVPDRFVELAIALSITYVACENLLSSQPRNPWLEAFGFGLLHGLGFAGFLGDALRGETLVVSALFGFNLGVELGQLVVVLVVALVLVSWKRLFRRRSAPPDPDEPPALVPRGVRVAASVVVALLGLYWFCERAGWTGWLG